MAAFEKNPREKNVNPKLLVAATSPVHFLTAQQKIFVEAVVKGKSPQTAARMAGYSQPEAQGKAIALSPKIAAAVAYLHKKHEKVADMSRKKVMDGILESIEMAKIQADPGNMIAGWKEIAKMCGYYAPEVKKIDLNITTKRVIDKLETLSDDELVKLIDESSQVIEIEAREVLDDIQKASDE